jgi:hypothetical protein
MMVFGRFFGTATTEQGVQKFPALLLIKIRRSLHASLLKGTHIGIN